MCTTRTSKNLKLVFGLLKYFILHFWSSNSLRSWHFWSRGVKSLGAKAARKSRFPLPPHSSSFKTPRDQNRQLLGLWLMLHCLAIFWHAFSQANAIFERLRSVKSNSAVFLLISNCLPLPHQVIAPSKNQTLITFCDLLFRTDAKRSIHQGDAVPYMEAALQLAWIG